MNLTIRYADSVDELALRQLAALDSALPLSLPALVADVEGALHAALSLTDGCVVADPFTPTAGLIELLQVRAGQLAGKPQPRPRRRLGELARVALRPQLRG